MDRICSCLHGVGVVASVVHQRTRADDSCNVNWVWVDVVVFVHQPRLALGHRTRGVPMQVQLQPFEGCAVFVDENFLPVLHAPPSSPVQTAHLDNPANVERLDPAFFKQDSHVIACSNVPVVFGQLMQLSALGRRCHHHLLHTLVAVCG